MQLIRHSDFGETINNKDQLIILPYQRLVSGIFISGSQNVKATNNHLISGEMFKFIFNNRLVRSCFESKEFYSKLEFGW